MLTANVDQILKELQTYTEEVKRKLTFMAKGFAYQIAATVIENTPLGDAHAYFLSYLSRQEILGLDPIEGFARGSWQANTTGQFAIQEYYTANSGEKALTVVKAQLGSLYTLGAPLYIGNKGFYIDALEGGSSPQAPMGISAPSMDSILSTYKADLKRLYDQG